MLRLFLLLNARLWRRSLNELEIAAIIIYGLFLLLVAGQVSGLLFLLLFSPRPEIIQEIYPGITQEVQFFIHLVFLNALWLNQIFFTKINRLPVHENRKLLTFGMPVKKLSVYLNIAGFFHPVNMLFHAFWVMYFSFLTESIADWVISAMLIVANYTLIHTFKWRFRLQAAQKFGRTAGYIVSMVLLALLLISNFETPDYSNSLQEIAHGLIPFLLFTPGALFHYIFSGLPAVWVQIAISMLLSGIIGWAISDMIRKSRHALLTPLESTAEVSGKSYLPLFIKWLGPEGGKFVYTIWNHKYSKMQLLIVYLIVVPFLFFFNDGLYITGIYLAAIPMTFILVMLTNMFGFENRELLLTMQLPVPAKEMIHERVQAVLKVCVSGSAFLLLLIPLFINSFQVMLQFSLGVLFISFVFLHLGLYSCMHNYKKIEEVGLMSVSNPVLPASITFMAMLILIFCGLAAFIVIEGFIWYHIFVLTLVNAGLYIRFRGKLNHITKSFNQKVLPELWNEL